MKFTKAILVFFSIIFLSRHYLHQTDIPREKSYFDSSQKKLNFTKIQQDESKLIFWNSSTSPNELYRLDSYTGDDLNYYDYYQAYVTNLETKQKIKIYAGTHRTLNASWTPDNKVKITYNCGNGCLATKITSANNPIVSSSKKEGQISEKNNWQFKTYSPFHNKQL